MSDSELCLQEIGKRIMERRKKLGLTQEALAEKGDVTFLIRNNPLLHKKRNESYQNSNFHSFIFNYLTPKSTPLPGSSFPCFS